MQLGRRKREWPRVYLGEDRGSPRGREGAAIRRDPTSAEARLLSPKQGYHPNRAPGSAGAASDKRPLDECAVEEFVTVTPLDTLRGLDGATFVPMMQPAHLWDRDDPPGFWSLDGA